MPFVPVPLAARVELRFTAQSQHCLNTLWFEHLTTAPDAESLFALTDLVNTWWVTNMRPITSGSVLLREVYALAQDGGGVEWTLATDPTENSGTSTGEPLPNNVTLCVSFRTGLAGRSYRGRNYPVGITRTDQNGNYAVNAYGVALQEAYAAILTAFEGSEWTWVVATRYSNNLPRPEGAVTPVTAVVVTDLALDSQRRRLVGRGD